MKNFKKLMRLSTLILASLMVLLTSAQNQKFVLHEQLPGTAQNHIAWGDMDKDGDLDLFCTPRQASTVNDIMYFYYNEELNFTDYGPHPSLLMPGLDMHSYATFNDFDYDGDLDLMVSGDQYINESTTILYENIGNNGYFNLYDEFSTNFSPIAYGSQSWGDMDNDGDQDVIITGQRISQIYPEVYYTDIFLNNSISFQISGNNIVPKLHHGQVQCADYNSDGLIDFVVIGDSLLYSQYIHTIVYRNIGFNHSTNALNLIQLNSVFQGLYLSAAKWGDFDCDGDMDLAIIGNTDDEDGELNIYKNNGSDNFTLWHQISEITRPSNIAVGDIDNNGYLNLVSSGFYYGNPKTIVLCYNPTLGTFYESTGHNLENTYEGALAMGDFDNDYDLILYLQVLQTWIMKIMLSPIERMFMKTSILPHNKIFPPQHRRIYWLRI